MTAGMPAAVAISAATTFERMPPEPSGEVPWPMSMAAEALEVVDLLDEPRRRVGARIGGEEAVDVGEQDEQVGADEDRHLRGEEVVVAEGDLVGRRGVVLVDDRDDAPVEQPAQGLARVEVVGARAHVEEGQQHLRARHAALAQQLVVDAVELALAHGAGGLQVLDRGRARREAHELDAARDRARGHHDDVVARGVAGGDLVADPRQHGRPQRAGVLGDDARTELDDVAGHRVGAGYPGSSSNTTPAISTSSPASKPAASSARIDAHAVQAVLDVRERLLVVEVEARHQALDRHAADAEGPVPHRRRRASRGRRPDGRRDARRAPPRRRARRPGAAPRRGRGAAARARARRARRAWRWRSPAPARRRPGARARRRRPAAAASGRRRGRPWTARARAAARPGAGRGRRARARSSPSWPPDRSRRAARGRARGRAAACARRARGSRGPARRRRWRPR